MLVPTIRQKTKFLMRYMAVWENNSLTMMSKFGVALYPRGLIIDKHCNRYLQYMLHGNGKKEATSVREVRAWYEKKGRAPNVASAY
jgi:hypothetical protein